MRLSTLSNSAATRTRKESIAWTRAGTLQYNIFICPPFLRKCGTIIGQKPGAKSCTESENCRQLSDRTASELPALGHTSPNGTPNAAFCARPWPCTLPRPRHAATAVADDENQRCGEMPHGRSCDAVRFRNVGELQWPSYIAFGYSGI